MHKAILLTALVIEQPSHQESQQQLNLSRASLAIRDVRQQPSLIERRLEL
jgi:hypothetical protein